MNNDLVPTPLELKVGSKKVVSPFFIVDTTSNYNVFMGRDWIHSNQYIPSSLH